MAWRGGEAVCSPSASSSPCDVSIVDVSPGRGSWHSPEKARSLDMAHFSIQELLFPDRGDLPRVEHMAERAGADPNEDRAAAGAARPEDHAMDPGARRWRILLDGDECSAAGVAHSQRLQYLCLKQVDAQAGGVHPCLFIHLCLDCLADRPFLPGCGPSQVQTRVRVGLCRHPRSPDGRPAPRRRCHR